MAGVCSRLLAYWEMTETYWEHLGVSESLHEAKQPFTESTESFFTVDSLMKKESFMVLLPVIIALSVQEFVG